MLVLVRHGFRPLYEKEPSAFTFLDINFGPLIMNGWAGVDLFFVLSGFLVGFHLLNRWPDDANLYFFLRYWLKRILRTFPLYYAIILIILLELVPFYKTGSADPLGELYYYAIFLQDYMGSSLLTPLWSLATEEKFYLLCPFLIWAIRNAKVNLTWKLVFLISLSLLPLFFRVQLYGGYQPGSYQLFFWAFRAPFHLAFDGLILGLTIAFIYHNRFANDLLCNHWRFLFYTSSTILLILLASNNWMNTEDWYPTIWILYIFPLLFSLLMISSIYSKGITNAFLSSKALRFVSRLSYSLYLCHMLVLPITEYFFSIWTEKTGTLYIILFFICFLLLSFIFSIILHILIEKPFLRLKERIKLS